MRTKALSFIIIISIFLSLFSLPAGAVSEAPAIHAQNAMLLNLDSGKELVSINTDARIYPSSMVKLMTALLACENIKNLEDMVTVSDSAIAGLEKVAKSNLVAGEEMSARDLLCCAMLNSSGDACNALAETVSGSIDSFVAKMNEKAAALGMGGTQFANTHGAHSEGQYTTVSDLKKLSLAVLQNKTLMNICDTQYRTIDATNKNPLKRYYYNKNYFIINNEARKIPEYYNRNASGMMVAESVESGYCLISKISKNNMNMLVIIMNSAKIGEKNGNYAYRDANALSEWCFANFQYLKLIKAKEPVTEAKVKLSSTIDKMTVVSGDDYGGVVPAGITEAQLEKRIDIPSALRAPLKKGQEVGKLIYSYEGVDYGAVPLVTQHDANVSGLLVVFDAILSFFKSTLFKLIIAMIILLVILYFVLFVRQNKRLHIKRKRKIRYYKKHR